MTHRLRAVDAYAAAGALAIGFYYLVPANSVGQTVLYGAIGISSVVALLAGTRLNLPASARLPWYCFAVGVLAFAVGDAIFNVYALENGTTPFPSVADAVYLSAYPVIFLGMALVVRRAGRRVGRSALLEAAIVGAGYVVAQWVFVLAPAANNHGAGLARAISVAYPAMDILLAATLAGLLVTRVARTPSLYLLAASVVTLLVADEVYYSRNVPYRWLDAFWLASYVCWGAAALHPSVREPGAERRVRDPRLSPLRASLLAAALATAPVVLAVQHARGADLHVYLLAAGAFVIGLLVLLRMLDLVDAMDALRVEERQARTAAEAATRLVSEANRALRELDRLKDEFVGMISHDLRTPLTSISGYVELLRDGEAGPLNPEQGGFLEVVARNANRLLRLVDDLLFAARLQSGRLDVQHLEVDLAALAEHAVEGASPRAEEKGVAVRFEQTGPGEVLGDAGRLAQLLDNLVTNAVKFTSEGTVTVRVGREGDTVSVEVEDTGIGIPDEAQEQLFDRFFRAPNAVSRQIQGTGLGLFIADAIVEAHGGRIALTSSEGHGTTFRVELPAASTAAAILGE